MPGSPCASSRSSTPAPRRPWSGFSQGGHAALWAAQVAPQYTPEQPIFAGLVASTASEVVDLARAGATDPARQELTVWMLLGLAAGHPEAQSALGSVLTRPGHSSPACS